MVFTLFIGSVMMIGGLGVSIALFSLAVRMLRWLDDTKSFGYAHLPLFYDLTVASLWILLVLSGSIWGWALLYLNLDLFNGLEPALYFAIASFTTVGYGDIVLEPGCRLLAGMTATHGLLTFGLFTAFLVEAFNFPTRSKRR